MEQDNRWLQPEHPVFWIFVTGFLVYVQIFGFDLTHWDDLPLLQSVNHLARGPAGLVQAFKSNAFVSGSGTYYRPVLTLSFMFSGLFGGNDLSPQFLVNIVLHLTASSVLYLLLVELGNSRALSFLFSLLYVVHPALVQAVAWIPGRNDTLLGIFVFSSFLFFVRFARYGKWTHGFWHLFFFVLAIFTKETALALLLLCPLYLLLVAGKKLSLSSYGVLSLCEVVVVGGWAVLRAGAVIPTQHITVRAMIHSAWISSPSVIQYLGKAVFPFNLSVVPIMRDTTYVWGILAAMGSAAALTFSKNKRMSRVLFGLLFFLIFLFPSLLLTGSRQSVSLVLLEHRLYLPLLGFILVVLETDLAKKWVKDCRLSKVAVVLVFLPFALLAVLHCRDFKDEASFWDNALKNSPHAALVHTAIAQMLGEQGRRAESLEELRKALELNPYEFAALVNMSTEDIASGAYDEAEALLTRALAEEPGNPEIKKNLLATLDHVRNIKNRRN